MLNQSGLSSSLREEVRRAIDLLRFSSEAIYPLPEDIRIGLKGDHPKSLKARIYCFRNRI